MGPKWIRFNLSIALGASLVAHGGLIIWTVHEQIAETFAALLVGSPAQVEQPSGIATVPPSEPKKDPFELDIELGDWNGTGTAIAEAEGDVPLAGRRGGQDQPLLSRDPVGQGRIG